MSHRYHIPSKTNLILAAAFVVTQIYTLFLVPLLLHYNQLWAWTLVLPVLLTTSYWSLAHETFHGVFHPNSKWNERAGRLLCILFGAPYSVLRFGHLMHHRFNRTALDRTELKKAPAAMAARFAYYFRLLQGLYLGELASNLLVLLPKQWLLRLFDRAVSQCDEKPALAHSLQRQILSTKQLPRVRLDAMLIIILLSGAFLLYGESWFFLLAALLGRGLFISFFDNAYHYGTGLEQRKYAYNLALPRWLSRFILHFNLHRVHHYYPAAPWSTLPLLFEQSNDKTDGGYWALSLRQFTGIISLDQAADNKSA